MTDAELDEETAGQYNLILVGSPLENSWVAKYHGKVPLKFQDKTLTLGMHFVFELLQRTYRNQGRVF